MSLIKVFAVGPDPVLCEEVAAFLRALPDVAWVAHASDPASARLDARLALADVVAVDGRIPDVAMFVGDLVAATRGRVVVCASGCSDAVLLACLRAGASGFVHTDGLTFECLAACVRAVASGTSVLAPDLLARLLAAVPPEARPAGRSGALLTDREQQVLELIAAGHPTREVAERLCYSERTVKNVLHDVAVKLNARSRSQVVACAVREGLI